MMHTVIHVFSVIFHFISTKSYVVTIRWNRLLETIPTNGHTIGIDLEIRKLVFK